MLISGVCSVTFRHLGIKEIIELTRQANLATIEWGSDVHVLPGDIKQAAAAGKLCEQAGIGLYSYGSYYTAGEKESNDFTFAAVLASARALGVNTIRVWAGKKDYNVSDRDYFNKVVSDSKRIADLAAAFNISVSFEYHRNTLTSSN
ncbi:MAG TPA: sugar phosphate isomerase/epimerase, partial [Spirochaetota bacterium]|nr:sugar phosphate isomerase/epimerase [Spirochaetota bacterium]